MAGCGGIAASLDDLKFKPEINDAFELGMKYNGRGFDLNVALFHQLFRDFQLNTFNGLNFIVENINSCEDDLGDADEDNSTATGACDGDTRAGVKSYGIEIEAFTRPMTTSASTAACVYANTRYRDDLVGAGRAAADPGPVPAARPPPLQLQRGHPRPARSSGRRRSADRGCAAWSTSMRAT